MGWKFRPSYGIWYDWRSAAFSDSNGNLHDVEEWDGWKDIDSVVARHDSTWRFDSRSREAIRKIPECSSFDSWF